MTLPILILMLLGFNAFAVDSTAVKALLPAEVKVLDLGKTTPAAAIKALGKPQHVEKMKFFWVRKGLKYAIQLEFSRKNKLVEIHYHFTDERPELSKLGELDEKKLKLQERFLEYREPRFSLLIDPTTQTISRIKLR